jgi:O-antigen/teichoic acid export membrane protein
MTNPDAAPQKDDEKNGGTNLASTIRGALRSLAILGSGRILARLLMAAAVPLLARCYDAEAFGFFGVFVTACTAFTLAAAVCYEQGIVPARSDTESARLTYLSLLLVVLTSAALALVMVLVGPVLRLVDIGMLSQMAVILPIGVAFNAAVEVLLHWANRNHRDRLISSAAVLRALIMLGIQFGASWLAMNQSGLILGHIVGSASAAILLCIALPWPRLPIGEGSWWRQLSGTARRLSILPRLSAPRVVLEACGNILVISLLTQLFGAAAVGLYWMAQRVITIPSQIVDQPVMQFFYRSASAAMMRGDRLVKLLGATMLGLSAVAVPCVLILMVGADFLFEHLLGAEWVPAADYARIISIGWFAAQIALPLHLLPVLLGRLKLQFVFEIASQAGRLAAVLIAYAFDSFTLCLALLAAVEVTYLLTFGLALSKQIVATGRAAPGHQAQPSA